MLAARTVRKICDRAGRLCEVWAQTEDALGDLTIPPMRSVI